MIPRCQAYYDPQPVPESFPHLALVIEDLVKESFSHLTDSRQTNKSDTGNDCENLFTTTGKVVNQPDAATL